MNYPKIAFTDTIKKLQTEDGSRSSYARMEQFANPDGMTPREIQFIEERDSFYSASYGENEFPYVQHRGGPKGFLKVLDDKTLGFLDFSGNRQYITVGNIQKNNKVSLIMVDYSRRARLKIYAEAEVKSLADNPDLVVKLSLSDYQYTPERILVYHVKAYDWNCPQHITPRYTQEQIQDTIELEKEYIAQLQAENKQLKAQLRKYEP